MKYDIDLTEEAKADLDLFAKAEQAAIVAHIKLQLTCQPTVETRNRKPLGENLLAPWELRIGRFRVF